MYTLSVYKGSSLKKISNRRQKRKLENSKINFSCCFLWLLQVVQTRNAIKHYCTCIKIRYIIYINIYLV